MGALEPTHVLSWTGCRIRSPLSNPPADPKNAFREELYAKTLVRAQSLALISRAFVFGKVR